VKEATKNFFAPLRTNNMDTDAPDRVHHNWESSSRKIGQAAPNIVLTSASNPIQLQKQLKGVSKDTFELQSPKNGTRVVTKKMMDYQSVKTYFEYKNLSYYTFYPKSEKPIKAV
jgi:hypothetical protein